VIPPRVRAFDLIVVAVLLPFALVIGALVAVAVFLDSPGPVLYRSRRIGRGGRPFEMLKFRTMVRDAGGPPLSAHRDERYTPLGRTLATSRLDELPQLWNVLRGEMRLVGPRPELEEFVCDFPAEYEVILSVAPGLTGPAQVEYAWEGEVLAAARAVDRSRVYRQAILPYKLAIDMTYARHHSLRRDCLLLVRTLALPAVRLARRAGLRPAGPRLARAFCLAGGVVLLLMLAAVESAGL
jgi:lipopolysaccharide/colanic/teichoic acid biosynthesis glycosyltransferase